jgi:hypothetical protein
MNRHDFEEGEISKKKISKSKEYITIGKYSDTSSRSRDHKKRKHKRSRSKSRKDKDRRKRSKSHSRDRKPKKTDEFKTKMPKEDVIISDYLIAELTNVNKYTTKKEKDKTVEYFINEDVDEENNGLDGQNDDSEAIDYNKQREERRKRLEAIKLKQEENVKHDYMKDDQKEPVFEKRKTDIDNTDTTKLSKEDNERLLRLVALEREKNDLNNNGVDEGDGGEKTPDMFVETPVDMDTDKKIINLPVFDSYEDTTGYYTPKIGELINDKYKVIGLCGKGIFSTVVKVVDITTNLEYAIKIVRTIDIMLSSGEKERSILKKLNSTDTTNYIVKLIDTFDFNRHICMVFELYEMNLRELIRQKKRLNLSQVRSFAKQMLSAFELIHSFKILHADCKHKF